MKSALKVTDEKKAVFHSPIPHFHLALVVLAYLKADQPKVWNRLEKVGARVLLSLSGCAYLNQTNPFPSPSLHLPNIYQFPWTLLLEPHVLIGEAPFLKLRVLSLKLSLKKWRKLDVPFTHQAQIPGSSLKPLVQDYIQTKQSSHFQQQWLYVLIHPLVYRLNSLTVSTALM